MTIVLDGSGLTIDKLVKIARHEENVELHPEALERINLALGLGQVSTLQRLEQVCKPSFDLRRSGLRAHHLFQDLTRCEAITYLRMFGPTRPQQDDFIGTEFAQHLR